jgi:hypothetical protein
LCPLCTGSIPYKNHEKTSVVHKTSVDRFQKRWQKQEIQQIGMSNILEKNTKTPKIKEIYIIFLQTTYFFQFSLFGAKISEKLLLREGLFVWKLLNEKVADQIDSELKNTKLSRLSKKIQHANHTIT